jgi:beta-galactosidase GanA
MMVMDSALKARLHAYAEHGGTLAFTFRTAWKDDENNLCFGKRQPAELTQLVGANGGRARAAF